MTISQDLVRFGPPSRLVLKPSLLRIRITLVVRGFSVFLCVWDHHCGGNMEEKYPLFSTNVPQMCLHKYSSRVSYSLSGKCFIAPPFPNLLT